MLCPTCVVPYSMLKVVDQKHEHGANGPFHWCNRCGTLHRPARPLPDGGEMPADTFVPRVVMRVRTLANPIAFLMTRPVGDVADPVCQAWNSSGIAEVVPLPPVT